MSFTKVAPAGIGTSPGTSILIGDSLLHSTGIDIGSNTGVGVTIRQHGDATFTGIVTASSFSGDITGKATELATNATGTNLTLSGNLGVGGVVTYEDVTNIDSVGVVTARSGLKIGPTAGVAGTFFADGSYVTAGIITAASFHGSGANLTGITQTTIVNYADNKLVTATGNATTLNAEGNLTFDGNDLTVTGTAPAINFIDTDADDYKIHNVQGLLKVTDTTASADRLVINDNGTGYFLSNFQIGSTTSSPGATLHIKTSYPSLKVDSGGHASDAYVRIIAGNAQNSRVDFGDSDDDDIGMIDYDHANNSMRFFTNTSEKLRIESGGDVSIGNVDANTFSNYRTLTIGGAGAVDGAGIDLERSDGNIYGRLFADANGLQIGAPASGDYIRFETQNTERVRITSAGVVETYGGGGAAGLRIKNGGDLEIYANNNSDKVILYCDNNNELYVHHKIRFYNTSGGILRSNGQHALKPTGGCIQTKRTYRGSAFTNSSSSYQVLHSHDFNGIESGNIISIHFDADMNADNAGSSWQLLGLRIGSTMYSEKIIEHSAGMNMNASASGLTGAMSAGNHAVQAVTRNGGGQCTYNEGNTATGIVLHTYEYVS